MCAHPVFGLETMSCYVVMVSIQGLMAKGIGKLGTRKLAVSEVFWKVSRSFDKVVLHMSWSDGYVAGDLEME